MGCKTKDLSLDYLRKGDAIDETRIIKDDKLFNKKNRYLTAVATEKHGLKTDGQMLFRVETTTHKAFERNWALAADEKVIRAVPVEELFEKLDEIIAEKETKEKILLENVKNRPAVNRIVTKGFRNADTGIIHFTESSSESVNVNKKAKVSNKGFLNQNEDATLYNKLVSEYKINTGYEYNINSASFESLKNQKKFYDFLKKKGLAGIEVYNTQGELQMLSFNQPTVEEVDEAPKLKLKQSERKEEIAEGEVKTILETKEKYYPEEAKKILETYSLSEVNEMLDKDRDGAIKIFGKLLYGERLKSDTFVTDKDVNDQLNKCK